MVNKLLTISLFVLTGLAIGMAVNRDATANAAAQVYGVCNAARQETNGASEQACSDLQDRYGIEFLCKANNTLASNHCWTEVK